jgi:hypothetical protein
MFNPTPTIYKWDRFWVGFLPGLIAPLLSPVFFYAIKFHYYTIPEYLHYLKVPSIISPMLSFGALINGFIFFLLIRINYHNAARGVIGATILYGIPIIITKFMH